MSQSEINKEARVYRRRIETRKRKGITVTSNELWDWIRARRPNLSHEEMEKIFQAV